MTRIRPFCGLRPLAEYAENIAALPYEVMDTEEARAIINENALSFLSVTKSEATMSEGLDSHRADLYEKAKENINKTISYV